MLKNSENTKRIRDEDFTSTYDNVEREINVCAEGQVTMTLRICDGDSGKLELQRHI